ncbi:MAG: phenylalanine--tRNA ligase subunit alpha [Bacteroidales bacterium]|nr:phenylalanine--tRNA ligase subunit alpha [Bacteroidales bacterium]
MENRIKELLAEIEAFNTNNISALEKFRIKFLGKKGIMNDMFEHLKSLPNEHKKDFGQYVNTLKNSINSKIESIKENLNSQLDLSVNQVNIDLSLPVNFNNLGSRHPISIMRKRIIEIFERIGFTVSDGPEIEDDWHNFSALNFPEEHPARDMQDTFFIEQKPDIALRTHTSSVQVRVMESTKPPIRTISPGRVFRNEAISARAHCIFHQIEGLYIDKDVSFADLKQTLLYFAREMFGEDTKIRLRPSFFPFTEPSAEMDISCNLCKGKGCNICKYTGWVEILGCGMVDPNVLENCGIDSKVYTGFAFGMGIERMTMLKYQIKDLRLFFENDLNFLKQFESVI